MNKNEIQSVIINQIAQSYLTQCKISLLEKYLNQIAQELSPSLASDFSLLKNEAAFQCVLRSHECEFLSDLRSENDLVIQRIKELAPDFF